MGAPIQLNVKLSMAAQSKRPHEMTEYSPVPGVLRPEMTEYSPILLRPKMTEYSRVPVK